MDVDTCLRFITNIQILFELNFCFQSGQYWNLLSTLWSTIVSLLRGLLLSTLIVLIKSNVWSLLFTLSESNSQPIPKSPSNALVSRVSCSLLSIFLKMFLSVAFANSCNDILFLAGNQLYELQSNRRGWWGQKNLIAIFGYNFWLLSLDMKTKDVQHVPRINLSYFKFKRECSVGVLCANFAVSLSISFSAAPNFVIHHNLPSRNLGLKDFSFLELWLCRLIPLPGYSRNQVVGLACKVKVLKTKNFIELWLCGLIQLSGSVNNQVVGLANKVKVL